MNRRLSRRTIAVLICALATVLPATPARADSTRERQWHLNTLDIAAAHRISTGRGVTVAVIDSGVDASHPDLAGSVVPGIDLTGHGGDGRTDVNGHGTGMAGLIAARGHGSNGQDGAIGIAPDAKILPIRAATRGFGNPVAAISGIRWAVEHGANVISISSVGGASTALRQAIQEAIDHNIVVVAAAGNRPADAAVGYPARYPGVVAVGATDRAGAAAKVSVTGPEVTLLAPGADVLTTNIGDGYRTGTGTSDSTAIVAGAAALIRAKYPNATAAEVVDRLVGTAIDKGPTGRDPQYGYGVLNLVAALTATTVPHIAVAPTTGRPVTTAPPASALPATDTSGPLFRISPVIYVAVAILLVLVAVALGLLIWFVTRSRRRPS